MLGRPSSFTQALADTICERIADGESLRAICLDEGMPNKATVFRWLGSNESFRDQYARARETQVETMVDEIPDIADDGSNDWMERHDKDGKSMGYVINGEAMQRSKLRIDARKWIAAKMLPKKYGEKLETTLQGPDGGDIKITSKRELGSRLAFALRKGLEE